MIRHTYFVLESEEAMLVRRAVPNLGLGASDEHRDGHWPEGRALNTIANSQPFNARILQRALAGISAAQEAAVEQADPDWWRTHAFAPIENPTERTTVSGTPLIADPEQFCAAMAETRQSQLRDLIEVHLMLLRVMDEFPAEEREREAEEASYR